ncbi:MAG: response regulator [Flavobacteriales bacterium]|nr:response regulator [Flavobacteriales bacterium]
MTISKAILKKVVFIDDDPATNLLHKILAKSMNLAEEVEFYETAEQALKAYDTEEEGRSFPTIFFVDIGLPRMSGHELSVELRGLPGFQKTKSIICFLTGSKDIRDVVRADNNQFNHYFWKPLDDRKIKQLLREGLNIGE